MNPEVLKCHEDLITLDTYVQQGKTMDNKLYIYVKTLTSLAKWGPGGGGGGFNNQTGPILVHIYPPFNNSPVRSKRHPGQIATVSFSRVCDSLISPL